MNRILIVEDEPRLASFLEKGLRANGFVTTTSRDGFEATMLAADVRAAGAQVEHDLARLEQRALGRAAVAEPDAHPGQVLSREQLLSHVWGYDHDPGSNVVDVYVGYLRRKLGRDRIATVRGMGYALRS